MSLDKSLDKADVLLGPPGTGKTTTLLNRIEALLARGVPPEEIAFVSFTKAATREATERAATRFDIDPERFAWFRTIHSMAYAAMGDRVDVMEDKDWKDFGTSCAYEFSDSGPNPEGTLNFGDDGDSLRSIDGIARSKRISVAHAMLFAGEVRPHITTEMVDLYRARLLAWKREKGKIDFHDMLERALVSDWRPPVRFAFADEAQDNSRIQNGLLRHWFLENGRCESLTYAGDDDQGIYGWSGAEPKDFVWLARHVKTDLLSQSYRIPLSVHTMAQSIIRQNKDRVPKEYRARAEVGGVTCFDSMDRAVNDLRSGDSFILVRNVMYAAAARTICLEAGRLFSTEVGTASPLDRKGPRGAYGAIAAWHDGLNASAADFRALLSEIPSGKGEERILPVGVKARSEKNVDAVPVWRARDEFKIGKALDVLLGAHPFDLLVKLAAEERGYLSAVFRDDRALKSPKITITTKHRSKGREADNVVVLSDMSGRFARRRDDSVVGFEEENCVAYVAVTRAKKRLLVVRPSSRFWYSYERHARAV